MSAGAITMARQKKGEEPTREQLAKGGFARKYITHVDTNTIAMAHVSRHDPVERWIATERLTDGQIAAIQLCRHLWSLAGLQQRVTASYGERVPQGSGVEHRAISVIEAAKDLHRIQDYIPRAYWSLFEHIVRFGEAAEVAGERLNFGTRSAADRAHQCVCFVADIIAMKEGL